MQKGKPYLGVHDYLELMAIEGQGRGREGEREREGEGRKKKEGEEVFSSMYIVCLPWHKRYYTDTLLQYTI